MNPTTSVIAVFSLIPIAVLAGAYFLEKEMLLVQLLIMICYGIFCVAVPVMTGFVGLIIEILGFGFYLVWNSWAYNWDIHTQGIELVKQTIFSAGALGVWLVMYHFKKTREEIKELRKEVERLRKYDMTTGILTVNEFLSTSRVLYAGMKRRKENGYYVTFSPNSEGVAYKDQIIFEKMVGHMRSVVRKDYDLIGNLGEHKIVLFLSNTDEQGVNVVLERYKNSIAESRLEMGMIQYKINKLPIEWSSFRYDLLSMKRGVA